LPDYGTLTGGDAIADNKINVKDASYIKAIIDDGGYDYDADVDGDGDVDVDDLNYVKEHFGEIH